MLNHSIHKSMKAKDLLKQYNSLHHTFPIVTFGDISVNSLRFLRIQLKIHSNNEGLGK